ENKDLKKQLQTAKRENKLLKNREKDFREKENVIAEKEKKITELTEQEKTYKQAIKSLESNNKKLTNELDQTNKENSELRTVNENQITEKQKNKESFQVKIKELEEKLTKQEKECEKLQNELVSQHISNKQEKQNSEQEKTNYQTIIQNLEIAKNKKESEATHLSSLLAKIEKEHNQELLNQNREWKEKLEKGRTQNGFFTITISGISYLVGKGISRQKLQEKYGKGINKIEQLIDKLTNDYQTAQTQLNEANTKRQKAEQERDRYQQDYQNEKTRANNLQTQLDSHICSAPPTCSHTDYEQIKNEQDNYKSQLEQQEKELTQKLNTDLNLNLKNEPKLEQVITRLQELLRQPSFPPKNMSGENLEMVKQIDLRMLQNAFSQMTRTETQAIEQTISYQQLATVRNEIIRKYLTNNTQTISPPKGQLIKPESKLPLILIGCGAGILLTLAIILIKLGTNRTIKKPLVKKNK
ncbi:531_t:CDS:2, partial [Entrophospora sp. SA101]